MRKTTGAVLVAVLILGGPLSAASRSTGAPPTVATSPAATTADLSERLPWEAKDEAIRWCGDIWHQEVEDCFWSNMDWWGCDEPVDFFDPWCYAIALGACIGCGGLYMGPKKEEQELH